VALSFLPLAPTGINVQGGSTTHWRYRKRTRAPAGAHLPPCDFGPATRRKPRLPVASPFRSVAAVLMDYVSRGSDSVF
jgi:hypothetical protein